MTIAFVSNMCPHYFVKLFEMLGQRYEIKYFFTGGYENYWDKDNRMRQGDFNGEYLGGLLITSRFKISPRLFCLLSGRFSLYVKTIDDRFAMAVTFIAAKLRRKPFVLWAGLWHHPQTFVHKLTFGLTKYIYRHSDAVVVYGTHVKDYLTGLGVQEEKIFIAPHSVDNAMFDRHVPEGKRMELIEELHLKSAPTLLYVGRLEECKGIEHFIEALFMIDTPNLNVLFIGSGENKEIYETRCQELKAHCLFLGHIPNGELYRYYNLSDVFILPSITTKSFKEPWGLVVNEAMNQGCAVIATDAVGAAAGGLVEDGKNGFIVPERDGKALGEALKKLLNDGQLCSKMGRYAREKMRRWNTEGTASGFVRAIDFALACKK